MTPAGRALLWEIGKLQNLGRPPRMTDAALAELEAEGLIDTYQPTKGGPAWRLTIKGWVEWGRRP